VFRPLVLIAVIIAGRTSAGQRFTPFRRLLHWLMAVCILPMLFIGIGMASTVTLVSIHKPLGVTILMLALVRLAVRLRYGAPPLPADLPEPMKLAAQLSHYALYALMIGMPLLGWGMLSAPAYPVVLFGGVQLPAILPQSDSLHALLWNAHFYLAFAFFALVLLHPERRSRRLSDAPFWEGIEDSCHP
jgi:cytochrome b561